MTLFISKKKFFPINKINNISSKYNKNTIGDNIQKKLNNNDSVTFY